ncbi:MAG: methyltransferase domain-containing protein [Alphaproteobacteria bacterium]|nr:methyltransferase domain-containing protein [Alphaproteobacteria bacterium]
MILRRNLPRLCALAARAERVLDVGGWWRPFNLATHVIDVMPHATRHSADAIDPEHAERFAAESWIVHDACRTPWPFPDKFFEFSFCSHTLEDVRDPIAVCGELIRVAKAGYIETPSRQREIFSKARFFAVRMAAGRLPPVGFDHHRWFVEIEGAQINFTPKDLRLLASRRNVITRSDLGRKMTEEESGVALFWNDGFAAAETTIADPRELRTFRDTALRRLRG